MTASDRISAAANRMRVGVNYTQYQNMMGNWFGPVREDVPEAEHAIDRLHRKGASKENRCWEHSFPRLLEKYRQHHISMVRLHLLGNADNYGSGYYGNWREPHGRNVTKWIESYPAHLRQILTFCRDSGLRVTLSLISFDAFFKGARPNLAIDERARQGLLTNVLDPMLDVCLEFPETVEAWETMNEPNWATTYWLAKIRYWTVKPAPGDDPQKYKPVAPVSAIEEFLIATTDHIKAYQTQDRLPNLKITHGFTYGPACYVLGPPAYSRPVRAFWWNASDDRLFAKAVANTTNYERQLHYYPHAVSIRVPSPASLATTLAWRIRTRSDLPACERSQGAFLGEISAQKPNPSCTEPDFLAWPALDGRDEPGEREAVYHRLIHCEKLGYQKVYLWTNRFHEPGDPDSGHSMKALEGVDDFAHGP